MLQTCHSRSECRAFLHQFRRRPPPTFKNLNLPLPTLTLYPLVPAPNTPAASSGGQILNQPLPSSLLLLCPAAKAGFNYGSLPRHPSLPPVFGSLPYFPFVLPPLPLFSNGSQLWTCEKRRRRGRGMIGNRLAIGRRKLFSRKRKVSSGK